MIPEILLYVSAALAIIGAIGILRFPDFYTRTHAATIVGVGSFSLALLAIFAMTFWGAFSIKLVAIILINLLAGPVATHALADAAYKAGVKPKGLVVNELEKKGAHENSEKGRKGTQEGGKSNAEVKKR